MEGSAIPPEPRVIETAADGAHKRKAHQPLGHDKRGWQVAPAPDGRGTPPTAKPPAHRTRGFMWFVVALLAVNVLSVLLAQPSGQPRVTVPFSPYFIQAVSNEKVASITTKGDAVQGTFKAKVV